MGGIRERARDSQNANTGCIAFLDQYRHLCKQASDIVSMSRCHLMRRLESVESRTES